MKRLIGFSFLLIFAIATTHGQKSIVFYENALEAALSKAKKEGKDVFLDSYAPWCKPCKKMDRVFRNKKVAGFYNEHFVSVKVNVDIPEGKEIAEQFGIVFLPTMLIMDADGNVKQRIDGVMNADQMLQIGQMVVKGNEFVIVETTPKKPAKLSKKVTVDPVPVTEPGEKILFVLDDPESVENPDYLFHEAFFRLQQMDGSHDSIVTKYLATQGDWSTEKNMKFILNFMDNTDSEMFKFYAVETELFSNYMGAEKYRNTLEILINDCLYRKIPRPEPQVVKQLFSYLYPRKSTKYAHLYLLNRFEEDEDYEAFVGLAENYLETMIQPDPELLYKSGKYKCLKSDGTDVKDCVFKVEESIRLTDQPHYDQYLTLAKLYLIQSKHKKSSDAAEKARLLSLGDTKAQQNVNAFIAKLDKS